MKRKFDVVSKEVEKKCIHEIITRIEEIEESKVGIIAAQDIIDIVKQNYGPAIYNSALKDADRLLQTKLSDLGAEFDLLTQ